MTPHQSPFRVRPVAVEEPRPTGAPYDYADAFEISSPAIISTTAEELAAHAARVPSRPVACAIRGVLRYIVGFPEPAASADDLLGWPVVHCDAETVRLEGRSWLLHAVIVLAKPEPAVARISTFVGYQHPVTRVLWGALSPAHRRVAPRLLQRCLTDSVDSDHGARPTSP